MRSRQTRRSRAMRANACHKRWLRLEKECSEIVFPTRPARWWVRRRKAMEALRACVQINMQCELLALGFELPTIIPYL